MTTREFDVVICGATGFVGRQTVDYFVRYAPSNLRWAIAGRSLDKLQSLQSNVPQLVFDSLNQAEVDPIVARTTVILSTAGPFRLYSDLLVDACVRMGTHYVDISGETARIRDLVDHYHKAAINARVRIVPFVVSVPRLQIWRYICLISGWRVTSLKQQVSIGWGEVPSAAAPSLAL